MNNKKWIVLVAILLSIFMAFMWYFLNSNKYNPNASQYSSNLLPEVTFQNSLPVGSIVNLPKLTSISGRIVPNTGKRVFLFVSRTCGSCEYISLTIPKLAKTFSKLTWVYVEKSSEPPIIGTSKLKNLYIVKNGDANLSSLFESKYTPTFFFIDNDNKIVWKRRGFIPSDYYTLKEILLSFQDNNYGLLKETYQRNIVIKKKFPQVVAYTYPDNKKILMPDNFIGKPTFIFLFSYSCKACLNAASAIPNSIKNSSRVNKIVVFSPFSKEVAKDAISFAKEFGFKEIEFDLSSPVINVKWSDINNCFLHSLNTTIINDANFNFQYSIGWPGFPVLIVTDKNAKILYTFYLGDQSERDLMNFYEKLYKNILK